MNQHSTSVSTALARPVTPPRRREPMFAAFNLGLDPPLGIEGERHDPIDRRLVSLRWLAGTILTGFAGAGLIGSAMYAAFDRQSSFAEPPEMTGISRKETAAGELVNPKKADRILKSVDIVAAKQSFRTPTTVNVGDKEVVRVKTFTRVSTTLLLASAGFSDDVPPFNPLRLLNNDGPTPVEPPQETAPVQDDAEVSFVTRDLSGIDVKPTGATLTLDEVQAQVAEHIRNATSTGARPPLAIPSQLLLMRTSRASLDTPNALGYAADGSNIIAAPFSSIEVRMVPENVTPLPRSSGAKGSDERLFVVHHGESLEDVLRNAGIDRDQAKAIATAVDAPRGQPAVLEGERVKVLFLDMDGEGHMQAARVAIYHDDKVRIALAMDDSGRYVQVAHAEIAPPDRKAKSDDEDDDDDADDGRMRLYDSLYETALKQGLPPSSIDALVRIFSNDVDFQRPVTAGDSFDAFFEDSDETDQHDVLFASITAHGETFHYYRFQTDDGVDYFDDNGRSTRKFLVRQPIATGRLTSGFGGRYHPILGYTRMHTGVDWAAPIGTPIFAAGNGTIIKAGRESGYGNRVEIQHANGYITTYNHMTGFARGITEGVRVKQGQVVGFLGMTGLATGPHLHYEVIVNGHFVDPLRVKLARTKELDGRAIAQFKREKDRIDGLVAKAPNAPQVAAAIGRNGG